MKPYIVDQTADYAVVYKPPRMHCVPLEAGEGGTLLDWYAAQYPAVLAVADSKRGGGLMHRLDFETRGLALIAKTRPAYDFFRSAQEKGAVIKEYGALCVRLAAPGGRPGFPPPPPLPDCLESGGLSHSFVIESFFRPFGPGRKQVRPLTGASRKEIAADRGAYYRTTVTDIRPPSAGEAGSGAYYAFTVRIQRGFRHQIRCHLAWAGFPIANDPLYGQPPSGSGAAPDFLALHSRGLLFTDPASGEPREYRIAPPW